MDKETRLATKNKFIQGLTHEKRRHRIDIPMEDIDPIADILTTTLELINQKIGFMDMITSFDFLGDVMLNQCPELPPVSKEQRIPVAMLLMDQMPSLKGKLTEKEKEMYAFCIYYANCVQRFEKETNSFISTMGDFISPEKIRSEYEYEKRTFPKHFEPLSK